MVTWKLLFYPVYLQSYCRMSFLYCKSEDLERTMYTTYVYVTDFNQVYVYKTYLFCSTKSSFKSTFVCKLIQGRLLGDRGKEKGLFVGHDRSKTFFLKEISISTSPLHLPRIYFDLHRTLCESPEI